MQVLHIWKSEENSKQHFIQYWYKVKHMGHEEMDLWRDIETCNEILETNKYFIITKIIWLSTMKKSTNTLNFILYVDP